MRDIILKATDLSYTYEGETIPALNELSAEIPRGKKIACMGSNGSGKSTFFLCLNGILKPSSGTLYYNGEPMRYSRKGLLDLRSKVQIVFQDPDNQLFSASVYQEISFGVLNLGYSKEDARKRVEKIIDEMCIRPFSHKPTHALSGGQKKQVSIADILVMEPEVILLDEPSAALDPKHTQIVRSSIDTLTKQGVTVIMATHDADYALGWADEILLFHDGQIISQGTPEEVFSDKEKLHMTNLEQPVILRLFGQLCRQQILSDSLPVPKNLKVLEQYIADIS